MRSTLNFVLLFVCLFKDYGLSTYSIVEVRPNRLPYGFGVKEKKNHPHNAEWVNTKDHSILKVQSGAFLACTKLGTIYFKE